MNDVVTIGAIRMAASGRRKGRRRARTDAAHGSRPSLNCYANVGIPHDPGYSAELPPSAAMAEEFAFSKRSERLLR